MIYIGNLGCEFSVVVVELLLYEKLEIMESKIGWKIIDVVIVSLYIDISGVMDRIIV